jgi:hypothetical protein
VTAFTHSTRRRIQQIELKFKEDISKVMHLTLGKVHQECQVSFEMWCWGRMEKIIWTDRVRNEVLL